MSAVAAAIHGVPARGWNPGSSHRGHRVVSSSRAPIAVAEESVVTSARTIEPASALLDALGAGERVECGVNASGVRGLFAARSLRRGEPVLEIPLREYGLTDDPGETRMSWSRQLGRKLVHLRRDALDDASSLSDAMRNYAGSLPKMGEPAPGLANDPACVAALAGAWDCTEAVAAMIKFAAQVTDSYAQERTLDPTLALEEWRWAMRAVHSRTFRVEDERGVRPTRRALIAAADLLNHTSVSDEVNCGWVADDAYFVVSATRDVPKNGELLFKYGDQSDAHFALFHGFVPSTNPHNRVLLFPNATNALDWYQTVVMEVPFGAPGWDTEKERVRETTRKTFGTYRVDARTGLRHRVIQDLYLREDGVASGSARMLFEEMCGDEAYASEVIARRAKELRREMEESTPAVDAALAALSQHSRELVRRYRQRKMDILSRVE